MAPLFLVSLLLHLLILLGVGNPFASAPRPQTPLTLFLETVADVPRAGAPPLPSASAGSADAGKKKNRAATGGAAAPMLAPVRRERVTAAPAAPRTGKPAPSAAAVTPAPSTPGRVIMATPITTLPSGPAAGPGAGASVAGTATGKGAEGGGRTSGGVSGGSGAAAGQARRATAGRGSGGMAKGGGDYRALLLHLIEAKKQYPVAARRAGREGRCERRLTISRDGTLKGVEELSSCGHPFLDAAATRAITAVGKFPQLPEEYSESERAFTVTITFTLPEERH